MRFAGEIPDGRVLLGRAMPYGEGRHLAPLVELVRTACGITDEDEPEVAVERVHRTLARLDNPSPSLWVPGALADRLLHLLGIEHESEAGRRAKPRRPMPTAATACSTPPPPCCGRWLPKARC